MIELPEANVLADQLNRCCSGREIALVSANSSPHKFAWFNGDPTDYHKMLVGKRVGTAAAHGGLVEVRVGDMGLLFGDGVSLRLIEAGAKRPDKHQLLAEFDDGSALAASVQMYGGLWCYRYGEFEYSYLDIAREKPSPLSEEFTDTYFQSLFGGLKVSVKAFLATEQRIPGLGNGVLQDILFNARIHPQRKISTLGDAERQTLYSATRSTLAEMTARGGRDTEKDLFSKPGGYRTILSRNTLGGPCPRCGTLIEKRAFMGGSIYYCGHCQQVSK